MKKLPWVLAFVVLFGAPIFYFIDYRLRNFAEQHVLRTTFEAAIENFDPDKVIEDLLGPDTPVANTVNIATLAFPDTDTGIRSVEERFRDSLVLVQNKQSDGVILIASNYPIVPRKYWAYQIDFCGDQTCPFDFSRSKEIPADVYQSTLANTHVYGDYEEIKWLTYSFSILTWVRTNPKGEVVVASLSLLDNPRNMWDVLFRQLSNYSAPYRRGLYGYSIVLPLHLEFRKTF